MRYALYALCAIYAPPGASASLAWRPQQAPRTGGFGPGGWGRWGPQAAPRGPRWPAVLVVLVGTISCVMNPWGLGLGPVAHRSTTHNTQHTAVKKTELRGPNAVVKSAIPAPAAGSLFFE
jgi:hypothetical protein